MKMSTNLSRLLIVMVLSLAFVFGYAQRIKPTSNIAPKQAQTMSVDQPAQKVVKNTTPTLVSGEMKSNYLAEPTETVLWSQMVPSTVDGVCASQDFEAAYDLYDCRGADDFTVTGGGWTVGVVKFLGAYWNGTGPAAGINIEFFNNDGGGVPGTSKVSFLNLPYTSVAVGTLFEFTVNIPATLFADGSYWIAIQGRMDFAVGGQFGISPQVAPQIVLERHWINPGGGFGVYTTWTPGTTVWPTQVGRDWCFQLETPIACPQPLGLFTNNITTTGARANWTAGGTEASWDVEYGASGFTPGIGAGTLVSGITNLYYDIPGLTFGTYDWYVRADCESSVSNWSGPSSFSIVPTYDCNWSILLYDTYGDGWNGAAMDVIVGGITLLDNITLGSGTGPATFPFGTNNGSAINLWFHTVGSWPGECYYEVYDNFGILVYTNPTNPPPTNVYLTGSCVPPACPPPTNLGVANVTATSADLTWTSTSGLSNIELVMAGIAPTGVPTYVGVTSPYTASPLSMATAYEFYVQDDCGVNGVSNWVGPYGFTTQCEIAPCVGIQENEADIPDEGADVTNGGCNSPPLYPFSPIAIGDTYCGQVNTYMVAGGQSRDTDWYLLDLSASPLFWDLTWTVTSEFDLLIFIIDATTGDCSNTPILVSATALPCATASVTALGLAPGVYYVWVGPSVFTGWPASTGPHKYSATLSGVSHPAPMATINPMLYDLDVNPGATATDNLSIGNAAGSLPLTYTATVQNYADAFYTASPLNVNYWTGSVDNTTPPAVLTQTSAVNGAGEQAGWFSFDVSSIPDNATILSIEFNGYANACNYPYWSLTPVTSDPLVATPDALYADITAEEGGVGDYNYFLETSTAAPGWRTAVMGGTANADLQNALLSNKFTVGMAETDHAATFFINFDGWNEVNKPYLTIEYTTTPLWLSLNGAQATSGTVIGGAADNINVGFNAGTLAIGTYTSEINIVTNEPGAKKTYVLPVTLRVGYRITGIVYYGDINNLKPQVTTTTITLTPTVPPPAGSTIPAGAGGAFAFSPLDNDTYGLIGGSGKAWGGLNAPDPSFAQQYILGTRVLTNLQKRAADINLSGTIQSLDVTMMKRRILGQTYASWIKPNEMVWDGPFVPGWHGVSPTWVQTGLSVIVAGSNVVQNVRCLFTGDVNESFTPLPNP